MFNYLKNIGFLFFLLFAVSCGDNENLIDDQNIIADFESIEAIINSFENTIALAQVNPKLDAQSLENYFFEDLRNEGMIVFEKSQTNKNTDSGKTYSKEFNNFVLQLSETSLFESSELYKTTLLELNNDVLSSSLTKIEKQELIDRIAFMNAFIDLLEELAANDNKSFDFFKHDDDDDDDCDGWWDCWGRCVAGTVGGAIGGAATGGLAPAAGCTVVLPVIGTVACGTVGAVAGGVSGALIGASEAC